MRKIIITGATSMVGISLVEECLKNNILVTAVSRKNSSNLERLPDHKNIKIIECDLDNLEDLAKICEDDYDVFYHLAWEATDKINRYNPILQNKNVYTSLKALEVAKKLGCHTFIGAGSQAEYGVVNEEKISPETQINPENAYGVAKYSAFKLTQIYAEQLGINHIWARIFSVYGKWDNEGTMIKTTIDKLLNKEETMFTKGEQLWDYLYSEDVGRAFYLMGLKGKDKSIYCVGSGKARELSEYIKIIGKELGESENLGIGKIEYGKNQVMKLCADIMNLTEDTGFVPKYEFEEGIKRTIDWQKSFLEEKNNVKRKN
ncbi:NAD-dependent epimerase/dehydratase family protein [Cetobacterium sp.]|uniref:NAD-dependent epimerase/dehydratase family protein n=1 Tax=Cetobacterium sp. TaxID=2071632 RepID=UPI0025B91A7B|nr:NAD-dependent epimerase/dehydratase family protein [Cetobacterium sp.]